MSKLLHRYASAVRSGNLRSAPDTTYSDSDVLGAAGLAAKAHPLAVALMRLFCGDNGAARDLVRVLSQLAWDRAIAENLALKRTQADDLAASVIAWHRDGVCKPCGGHGYRLIDGTRTIGDHACAACKGAGKVPFEQHFSLERRLIARWLLAEIEREQARAGPAALARLAPRLW